ncbi:MAG: hypothetical protein FWF35_04880 [Elusimicrobia bacterium]|nr:hypothetical protein [Elusimicrobiota bacterium]
MKRVLMLFVFCLSAVLLKADNVDMVTILPDDVAAFVRLDVKGNATMSKVVLGAQGATNTLLINNAGQGALAINKIFAGNQITVANLMAVGIPLPLQFQSADADTLVIEGNIGLIGVSGAPAIPTNAARLFINGVELDPGIPAGLKWANNVPVNGVPLSGGTTGTSNMYVLCTGLSTTTLQTNPDGTYK